MGHCARVQSTVVLNWCCLKFRCAILSNFCVCKLVVQIHEFICKIIKRLITKKIIVSCSPPITSNQKNNENNNKATLFPCLVATTTVQTAKRGGLSSTYGNAEKETECNPGQEEQAQRERSQAPEKHLENSRPAKGLQCLSAHTPRHLGTKNPEHKH